MYVHMKSYGHIEPVSLCGSCDEAVDRAWFRVSIGPCSGTCMRWTMNVVQSYVHGMTLIYPPKNHHPDFYARSMCSSPGWTRFSSTSRSCLRPAHLSWQRHRPAGVAVSLTGRAGLAGCVHCPAKIMSHSIVCDVDSGSTGARAQESVTTTTVRQPCFCLLTIYTNALSGFSDIDHCLRYCRLQALVFFWRDGKVEEKFSRSLRSIRRHLHSPLYYTSTQAAFSQWRQQRLQARIHRVEAQEEEAQNRAAEVQGAEADAAASKVEILGARTTMAHSSRTMQMVIGQEGVEAAGRVEDEVAEEEEEEAAAVGVGTTARPSRPTANHLQETTHHHNPEEAASPVPARPKTPPPPPPRALAQPQPQPKPSTTTPRSASSAPRPSRTTAWRRATTGPATSARCACARSTRRKRARTAARKPRR